MMLFITYLNVFIKSFRFFLPIWIKCCYCFVITYNQVIDKSSVDKATYSVKGYEAGKVFASTVNPFIEEKKEGKVSYVVILLKAGSTPKALEDVSVQQVKDIKTVDGKEVPAWKGSYKATNSFPINGGLMTK